MRITIDGPAGVGKTSVGRKVAEKFSLVFIQSGRLYRALAYGSIHGLDSESLRLEAEQGTEPLLTIAGKELKDGLDSEEIGEEASKLAKKPETRRLVNSRIIRIAERKDVLVEGRDIGTEVLPDADLKIYLTATPEERARRRKKQVETELSREEIAKKLKRRDERDQTRELAPLKPAEDAVIIDTTDISEAEVVRRVSNLTKELCDSPCGRD